MSAGVAEGGSTKRLVRSVPPQRRRPPWLAVRWQGLSFVVIAGVLLLNCAVGSKFDAYIGGLVAIYAVAALGQDWLMGRAGLVSFGGAAMMAVGAIVTATVAAQSWLPFPLPLLVGAFAGGVVGLVVGLPSVRLRGLYLVIGTLALQYVVQFLGQLDQESKPAGFVVPLPKIGGTTYSSYQADATIVVICLIVVMVLLMGVHRGAPQRAWSAIRDNDVSASIAGIGTVQWKLWAFVGSSAITALAGGMLAYYTGSVSYDSFSLQLAINLILMIYLGGQGTLFGPVLGAALVTLFPIWIEDLSSGLGSTWLSTNSPTVETGLYGILLALTILFERDGIVGLVARGRSLVVASIAQHGARGSGMAETRRPVEDTASVLRGPGLPTDDVLLSVEGLSVSYSTGARAVQAVSLVVPRHSIVALVGRNGAGKTSVLRGICGFVPGQRAAAAGNVSLAGGQLRGLSPYRIAKLGVSLVSERDKVFPELTIADHFRVNPGAQRPVEQLLERFPRLGDRWTAKAGLLSGGERQMLALAMAWQTAPAVLIVDELSLGLSPRLTSELLELLRKLCLEDGMSALVVEQDARSALSIADFLYVLDQGSVRWAGPAADITAADIAETYLESR